MRKSRAPLEQASLKRFGLVVIAFFVSAALLYVVKVVFFHGHLNDATASIFRTTLMTVLVMLFTSLEVNTIIDYRSGLILAPWSGGLSFYYKSKDPLTFYFFFILYVCMYAAFGAGFAAAVVTGR